MFDSLFACCFQSGQWDILSAARSGRPDASQSPEDLYHAAHRHQKAKRDADAAAESSIRLLVILGSILTGCL